MEADYSMMIRQITQLAEEEPSWAALLPNVAAMLMEQMENLNWAGFYLMEKGSLLLGPFQGKTACIRIPVGKGVCGSAVLKDRTFRVEDVHQFPGHIACDSASQSEIVIPLHKDGKIIGVLDMDSPLLCRFTPEDQEGLECLMRELEKVMVFSAPEYEFC